MEGRSEIEIDWLDEQSPTMHRTVEDRKKVIRRHTDLAVYQRSFELAMNLFALSKHFPAEERYSLTGQVRRSSRSVSANITEAWRNRRYPAAFVAKLTDAEAEAAETQTWIAFAKECEYLAADEATSLHNAYDQLLGMLITMIRNSSDWKL